MVGGGATSGGEPPSAASTPIVSKGRAAPWASRLARLISLEIWHFRDTRGRAAETFPPMNPDIHVSPSFLTADFFIVANGEQPACS